MKKVIGLPLLLLVLAALVALAPGAARGLTGDANGPSCRDITNGQFNYSETGTLSDQPPYTLSAQLLLGDDGTTAPCKQLIYTLYVIVDGTNPSSAIAFPMDGNVQWLNLAISDDDPDICVFATAGNKGKAFDTAPDSGCLVLHAGTTGGGSGFN